MNKYLIMLCLLLASCGRTAKIKHDLTQLYSRPITLSPNLSISCNAKDTVIKDYFDSEMKLVIYTDSSGCSSCRINRMFEWQPLIDYAQTFENKLKYYFVFRPIKGGVIELKNALKASRFKYPVLIDKSGDFERLNPHLPDNIDTHTLLLDRDNNVILVGSPLHNKSI